MGISKQTINSWTSQRRKIPKKHLPTLSEIFGISQDYFQKEINEVDKLKIQKLKIENEMEEVQYQDVVIDEKTGQEVEIQKTTLIDNGEVSYLQNLDYQIQQKELIQRIKKSLDQCFESINENTEYEIVNKAYLLLDNYNKFVDIVLNKRIDGDTLKKILRAINVVNGKTFDSDKFVRKIAADIKEYVKNNADVKRKETEEILKMFPSDE